MLVLNIKDITRNGSHRFGFESYSGLSIITSAVSEGITMLLMQHLKIETNNFPSKQTENILQFKTCELLEIY